MDLSIIIVNYNSFKFVKKCVDSIYKHLKNISFEIIIVDNNSTDKSILDIKIFYKDVILRMLEKNLGFGAGNNSGVELASGKFILFLNPDTLLIDSSIENMYEFAVERRPGIVCPVVYNPDLSIQYFHNNFHSVWYFVSEAFNFYQRNINKVIELDKSLVNEDPFRIDWALGAAMMIEKELFQSIGKFDERYFLYYEDADIAKRLSHMGLQNFCYAKAGIVHILSATSGDKQFSKFHVHRSRLIYIMKYFSFPVSFFLRIVFSLSIIMRITALPFLNGSNEKKRLKHNLRNLFLYFHSKHFILNSPAF